MKRVFDVVCSTVTLVLLSPVLAAIAIAIKVDSRGPVFYRGVRVGRRGVPFKIFKFRTMVVDAERIGASSTAAGDVRVTRIGRCLRRYKLDELPQLLNVVLGHMSLVGPRPEVQKYVDLYTEGERAILKVRPGITDRASVRFRNEGEIIATSGIEDADEAYERLIRPEKLRLQLEYVRESCLRTDLGIILDTLRALVHGQESDVAREAAGADGASRRQRSR